jgi:phosphatidylserine decarboxylase
MTQAIQPTPTREAPITCIQPGGGFCFSLEAAWGRCRRGLLRCCFPGYVRRMAALRQGACEGCPHDVIDPRDLKLVRNVCGYRFAPEDDSFAWRGRVGFARAGLCELLVFSLLLVTSMLAFAALGIWHDPLWFIGTAVIAPIWLFILSFFRDPQRAIPTDADALVSPADGTVTHLEEVDDPTFPGGRAFRVSIFLSVFDVHVNRVPRSATIPASSSTPEPPTAPSATNNSGSTSRMTPSPSRSASNRYPGPSPAASSAGCASARASRGASASA